MDARAVESGLDELFSDASKLTPEEAKAIGTVRVMLWKLQDAERAVVERFLTNRTA